jgi:hypothetical protein
MIDDFFTDDVIDDLINQAIAAVEAEQRWPWQEHVEPVTVNPDKPDINLGPLWRATRAVFDQGTELGYVAPSDLLSWTGAPYAGRPQIWTTMADRVALAPTPDSEYELIHYWYTAPEILHADDDQPEMPSQFTDSIVAKTAELLAQRESDMGRAATHLADYNAWIDRMRRDLRRSTGPLRTRVRPGGWV